MKAMVGGNSLQIEQMLGTMYTLNASKVIFCHF